MKERVVRPKLDIYALFGITRAKPLADGLSPKWLHPPSSMLFGTDGVLHINNSLKKGFEDTKGVIRSRKAKDTDNTMAKKGQKDLIM